MAGVLDIFRTGGRLNKPLLGLFLFISIVLLANSFLHDPATGYDARDHVHYVQSLATHWRLPNKEETGQYYSPPLPYVLPAALTAIGFGLAKALKLAQFCNAVLGIGLALYLLRICDLLSPQNTRLKLLTIGLLGLVPAFYRSFALIRGEPYLAFLGVFIAWESLEIFLQGRRTAPRIIALGLALGLSILARQWGFFLFPAVLVFAAFAPRKSERAGAAFGAVVAMLIGLVAGGWFYASVIRQYGTLTAFDRAPQPLSVTTASTLLSLDESSWRLFSDPIRPSLDGRALPILYADTWGDYWGYFLVYARDVTTGDYHSGDYFFEATQPGQIPSSVSTNRFQINHYLGVLNILDLVPSAVLLAGLVYGLWELLRLLAQRTLDDGARAAALFAMLAGGTLLGFLWFLLRYQSPSQGGDLVKATYLLQAYPMLALLAAGLLDRVWARNPALFRGLAALLGITLVAQTPAFLTHYATVPASATNPLFLLSTLLCVIGLGLTAWIHSRYPLDIVAQPVPPPADGPLISICVPARNEAANIRRCVQSILGQTYPNIELIAVDDRSTDATTEILKEFAGERRLRVIHGAELPEGWAGKPHALFQAAAAARGEWLCFVDADTFLSPDAIAACYARAVATSADLFTIMTRQLTGSFWEKVVLPIVMTSLSVGFPPREVNNPRSRRAVANGQFILIRRGVYEAVGGHERICSEIVEDKAIAELVKWNGYRLVVADGRMVASTRMYTSLPQMWEGWTKNIFLGLRNQPQLVFLGLLGGLLLVLAALFMPVWPLLGLWWYLHGGGGVALAVIAEALLLWAAVLYARASVAHGMGIARWYALTTPLGAAVFTAMMLASAWKVVSGRGVTWRGRTYNPSRT